MKKRKQNGITLIALIITIIVMLILVGVTVSVALNGGLFTTAKTAVKDTQYEADREILQSAIIGALNEELTIPDAQTLENNLPEGWTVTGSDGGPYTATSPNENKFKVLSDGTIKELAIRNSTELERYIFGENGEGRDFTEIFDIENMTFTDDSLNVDFLNLSLLKELNNKSLFNLYIKYDDKVYKFQLIDEIKEETESLTTNPEEGIILLYEPQGREGEKVLYDSDNDGTEEEWMILYDNGDNIEMISMTNMGTLTLGYDDETAKDLTEDIDKNGKIDDTDKAIYSYNNAITRLNSYCKSLVTNEDINIISVRNVGSNPTNPSSENNVLYTSETIANLNSLYNGIGKGPDTNYEQDLVRMFYYDANDTGTTYWLASRQVYDNSYDYVSFNVGSSVIVDTDHILWSVHISGDSGSAGGYSRTHSVRPVIKISSDAI